MFFDKNIVFIIFLNIIEIKLTVYIWKGMIFLNTVPLMISTKDLAYIADMFEWNFIASKKAQHFANEIIDPEIKELIERVSQMHAEHCRKLVNILR